MLASRFNDDFEDHGPESTIGDKLLAAADGLVIRLKRAPDGKLLMGYELEGTFGQADEENEYPRIRGGEAQATAEQLMKGFLGN